MKIPFLTNYIDNRAIFLEEQHQSLLKAIDIKKQNYQLELEEQRGRMFRKFCPLLQRDCYSDCVHYYEGEVVTMQFDGCYPSFKVKSPICKLWRTK